MPKKERARAKPLTLAVVVSTDHDREIAAQLRSHYPSDGAMLREALHRLHAATFPPEPQDLTGAILGWSEPRTATAQAECIYCGTPIVSLQAYRAADTIGDVGGIFAHVVCEAMQE